MKKIFQFRGCSKVSVLLCVIVLSSSVAGEQFPAPSARIALINLDSGHLLRSVTDKANHEVILTQPTNFRESYLFECNASYPLEWSYFGEGAPTTHADVGRHFVDFYNVNSYTYQAVLYLHSLDELQSGRYICRGSQPEQERLQVHYDLFVPGNGTQMLISNAEKKVFVSESKLMTSLPCEVTDPSLTLQLYKENSWGGFVKLDMNDSIMFRPRKGFIIKMHELPDPFGTYVCATPDNKRRRKVHLIPERFRQKYDDANNFGAKVPVHLSYDYEYSRMLCCNNANNGGDGGNINALAPKLQWTACGSVADCKIKSVCFEEDRCGDKYKWLEPGPLPRGCAGWKLTDGDFGIFKCSTPGVTQYQPFLLNRGNMFVDFEAAPPSESILTMSKTSSDPIYLGSEVEYHCNSTRFFFAFGLRWAFKRGNDDIEFIGESSSYTVRDEYPLMSHMRQTKFRILNPDIKAIICFVPIANSPTEWRTVSLPITIKDPISVVNKIATQRPGFMDFHNNRNMHSSSSHNYPAVVEPYSTSRPILLPNHPSMEVIDPTPSVDIDEIMSLGGGGGGKHPTNGHAHPQLHNGGHEMSKVDSFPSHSHHHQAYPQNSVRDRDRDPDRFPPVTTYPRGPYRPEYSPSQSMHNDHRDSGHGHQHGHGVPHRILNNHHGSDHLGSPLLPPPPPTMEPVRIIPTPVPEIITLDNVKKFQNEKYNFPSPAEIEEANMRHRHKFQMHHEGVAPYTTTPKSTFVPAPIDPSRYYHKYSHSQQNHDTLPDHHGHHYNFDEKKKYFEKPRHEDFSPTSSQHKEFKVSTRLDMSQQGIKGPNKESAEMGIGRKAGSVHSPVSAEKTGSNVRYPPSPYSHQRHVTPTTTTQKPFRYFNDKGYATEKDDFETFGAPIPVKLPQYQRQPVIHYDSREKQYGLRDPLIPVGSKLWKHKTSKEVDHDPFVEDRPVDVHKGHQHQGHHQHQSRPHAPRLHDPQPHVPRPHDPQPQTEPATLAWDRGYSHSPVSDSNLMKSPALDVEMPVVIEEIDTVIPNDYYTTSLLSSRRKSSSSNKKASSGRKSSSDTSRISRPPQSYHREVSRDKGHQSRYSSAVGPDYEGERDKYYYQRYADPNEESVGGVKTHDLYQTPVNGGGHGHSSNSPLAPEQTYLHGENTVRRHGRYNHYLTSSSRDFVKMG